MIFLKRLKQIAFLDLPGCTCNNQLFIGFVLFFQAKVYPYWPQEFPLQCADFIICKANASIYDNYIVRKLKVTNTKVSIPVNIKLFL